MPSIFPDPIRKLPRTNVNYSGIGTYLAQCDACQVLFMECNRDVLLPEHAHEAQWCVVLEGRIDISAGGTRRSYTKGDRYYIPAGQLHSGRVYAGYADITFFDQNDRCKARQQAKPV